MVEVTPRFVWGELPNNNHLTVRVPWRFREVPPLTASAHRQSRFA